MQVLNIYFKLLKKCIPIYIIYILAFLVLLLVKTDQNKDKFQDEYKISVGIVNSDVTNKFAMNLTAYLKKYCDIYIIGSKDSLDDSIYYGNINAIIYIPYGFMEQLQEDKIPLINIKAIEENDISLQLNGLINHYIQSLSEYSKYNNQLSEDDIYEKLLYDLRSSDVSKRNILNETFWNNIFIADIFNISGYILLGCLLVTVGTVISIYHDNHIKKRIAISLLHERQMYGQLFLCNFIFTLCLNIIIIIISYILTRNSISIFVMIRYSLNLLVYSISALALSYFFSILYNKKKNLLYFILIPLVLAFISGVFVTQDYLRDIILHIGSFNPLYWFVKNNNVMMEISSSNNVKDNNVLINMTIQLLFAGVFFVLSSLLIKLSRERE